MVPDAYGDIFCPVAPVAARGGLSCLIDGRDGWDRKDILLSKITDECASIRIHFEATETWCRKFIPNALDKAGDEFLLALQSLDALQKCIEVMVPIKTLA